MKSADWQRGQAWSMTVFLNGDAIVEPASRGEPIVDDSFLMLFNGSHEDMTFTVPGEIYGERWEVVIDTAAPLVVVEDGTSVKAGEPVPMDARSVLILRRVH